MKKILLLTTAICAIVLASCNKDKKTTRQISEELITYYNYQVGSYWVYYDSVSGTTDSLYVKERSTGHDSNPQYEFVTYTINIWHQLAGSDSTAWTFGWTLNEDKIFFGDGYSGFGFVAPYTPNISEMTLNGLTFNNVLRLPDFRPTATGIAYISREIGLVKYVSEEANKNYNLIKWNVIR